MVRIGPYSCNCLLVGCDPNTKPPRHALVPTLPTAHVTGPDSCDGTCYWSWPTQTSSATLLDISLVLRRGSVADDRKDSCNDVKDGRGRNSRTAFSSAQTYATGTIGIASTRRFQSVSFLIQQKFSHSNISAFRNALEEHEQCFASLPNIGDTEQDKDIFQSSSMYGTGIQSESRTGLSLLADTFSTEKISYSKDNSNEKGRRRPRKRSLCNLRTIVLSPVSGKKAQACSSRQDSGLGM